MRERHDTSFNGRRTVGTENAGGVHCMRAQPSQPLAPYDFLDVADPETVQSSSLPPSIFAIPGPTAAVDKNEAGHCVPAVPPTQAEM